MPKLKKLTLLPVLMLSSFNSFAQEYILTGMVKDSSQTIAFANVILTSSNGEMVTGTITEDNGHFSLTTKGGDYMLSVSFLGYKTWEQGISIDKDINLNPIYLREQGNQLKEVIITAEKPLIERKVDRLVFNVGQSIAATGGDAMDALKVTPRIKVQNDNISMIGKSNMGVMINGQLLKLNGNSLTTYLKSIPSDIIKSIEVIDSPPAKYSAEGNSGLINIILKRKKNDGWQSTIRGGLTQSTYSTGNLSANLNLRKNKFLIYSFASYYNGSYKRTEKDALFYPNRYWVTDFNKRPFSNSFNSGLTAEYIPNENKLFGIQYSILIEDSKVQERDIGEIRDTPNSKIDSIINTSAANDNNYLIHNLNLYSKIKLDTVTESVMDIRASYLGYNNKKKRDFYTEIESPDNIPIMTVPESNINIGEQDVTNVVGLVDFKFPRHWAVFETGAKVSFIKTKNSILVYDTSNNKKDLIQDRSNDFSLQENTQAIYLSGYKKFNDKWSIKAGLRVENTQTTGYSATLDQKNKNDYTELFPTFYLVYTLNENNSFSFDYNRRISRPSYSSLNPFRYYSSPYNYNEGNPFLQPQFSQNFKLEYGYKNHFYSSLYFLLEANGIGEIPIVNPETNVQYFTYQNYFTYYKYGLSQTYVFDRLDWLESHNSANLNYFISEFEKVTQANNTEGWGAYFSTNNFFVLNKSKTLKGELDFWYQSGLYDLIYKKGERYNLSIGIQASLLKKKMQVSLLFRDILRSNRNRMETMTNGVKQIYSSYSDNQSVRLTVTYTFGNNKVHVSRKKSGNESERSRTN